MKQVILTILFLSVCLGVGPSLAQGDEFTAPATFSLSPDKQMNTDSAFVVLTDELFNGKTNALEIFFFPGAFTDEQKAEINANYGKSLRTNYSAVMVLFIDKDNKIWQVNLTCVIPGKTVAYTVAWKPEDLKQFSDYSFDGQTLKLKSEGAYKDVDADKNPIELTWGVDLVLPVINEVGIKEK